MQYRYFIQLSYKGTAYHGWQVQPNAITVQEVLEKALGIYFQKKLGVVGAGRTDTGVHATQFYVHFDFEELIEERSFVYKVNRLLPRDIACQALYRVHAAAHARFDATARAYEYHISKIKDPFSIDSAYYYSMDLDVERMNKAAEILLEVKDFTSFSKVHTDTKTNNCRVDYAYWKSQGDRLVFCVQADRFLRNMVRAMVGTLLLVGEKKILPKEIKTILHKKDRGEAGRSVPAQGLYLTRIAYPETIFYGR